MKLLDLFYKMVMKLLDLFYEMGIEVIRPLLRYW